MDVRERLIALMTTDPFKWWTPPEMADHLIANGVTIAPVVPGYADKVITVDGFKAFRGTMRIAPKADAPAYDLHGDWLYKPETGCWFGNGRSYPADICAIVEVR